MPVSGCKINPFLAAVTSCRTVKVGIDARIGLIKDADEVDMFLPDGQTMDVELNAEGLTAFKEALQSQTYFAAR